MIWQAILVYVACAISDVIWAAYIKATAAHHVFAAAAFSAAIMLVGVFSVCEYTQHHWMALPAAAGAFTGTALYLHYKKP